MTIYKIRFNWPFTFIEEATSKDEALDKVLDYMNGEYFTSITKDDIADLRIIPISDKEVTP